MSETKNAVANKKETEVSSDFLNDYGADAGAGFEGTSGKDLSIPFLSILQSNSPQVEDENPKGSKPGLLYNTVTGELIEGNEGIVVIPVHKENAYVEWIPREQGAGFVGLHDPSGEEVKKTLAANGGKRAGKLLMENGHELVETHYVYALVLNKQGTETQGFCVLSFTSTKLKPYRDWITSMFTIKGKPPLYANRAVIKTIRQKNEKGSFFNFQIEPFRNTWVASLINPKQEAGLLLEAREFREMVVSGMAKAAFETDNSSSSSDSSSEDAPF